MKKTVFFLLTAAFILITGCVNDTKKRDDATLEKLIVKTMNGTEIELNQKFSPEITSYSAVVEADINKVKIIAESNNEKAKIYGAGEVDFGVIEKVVNVNVEAENGETKEYKITLSRNSTTAYTDNSKYYNYTRSTFPFGGGVDSPIDYTRSNIFVDLVRTAATPGLPQTPWLGDVKVDNEGWPLEDFGVILMRDQFNIENKGVYKVSFDCTTIPAIKTEASTGIISNVKRDSITGKITCDLTLEKDEIQMLLSFRNTNGGVRNLKVLRPGYTEKQTFTKEYLDHMDRYSTIRTMDFTLTNGSMQEKWSDRKKPTDGLPKKGRNINGASWEHCVELANTVKADLWINVPYLADKEYIRNLAILIKKQLSPELNLYFEYSNENWNYMFDQTTWLLNKSKEEPYHSKLAYDGETNQYYIQNRLVGEKLKECIDIFSDVWGKDEINKRVRPVLAAQIAWGETYGEPLKYLQHTYGDVKNYIYGVAGAPYFNMGDIQTDEGVTVDQILTEFEKSIDVTASWLETLRGYAQEYGVKMLAYEGGSDTFGDGSLAAKEAVQHDPRLKALIIKYIENWYYYGGDVFCWYVAGATSWSGKYGAWGLINTQGDDTGPKIEAVDAVIAGGMAKYAGGQIPTDNPKMDISGNVTKIDFENLPETGFNVNLGNMITVNGYNFGGTSGLCAMKSYDWAPTSYKTMVLQTMSWGSVMSIKKSDGAPFSLKSITLLRPCNIEQAASVKIKVYMHTRGMAEAVVNLPAESGREGVVYKFPSEWAQIGMKEIRLEFMELPDAMGANRFGAVDDLEIYDTVIK